MINTELPTISGGYRVVLADPPWSFASWSDKGKNRAPDAMVRQKGLAERHYATMTMDDIRTLPVGDVAAKDSVLLMWCVNCQLPDAIDVGQAWGFKFKTVAFVWAKRTKKDKGWHMSLGYYTRGQTEQCLLFTKGAPKRKSASVRQLIVAPRREHSRKPDQQYERIETLFEGPRLELFARYRREGWDCWGNQTDRFEERKDLFGNAIP